MEHIEDAVVDYKYKCPTCQYYTDTKVSWHIHIMSERHCRNGQKKPTKCDQCHHVASNSWNLKIHKQLVHLTEEEKEKQKYYCKPCGVVFLCESYQKKHNASKGHLNKLREIAKDGQPEIIVLCILLISQKN